MSLNGFEQQSLAMFRITEGARWKSFKCQWFPHSKFSSRSSPENNILDDLHHFSPIFSPSKLTWTHSSIHHAPPTRKVWKWKKPNVQRKTMQCVPNDQSSPNLSAKWALWSIPKWIVIGFITCEHDKHDHVTARGDRAKTVSWAACSLGHRWS